MMKKTLCALLALLMGVRNSISYHMAPGSLFDRAGAELFDAPGRMIVPAGQEIELE